VYNAYPADHHLPCFVNSIVEGIRQENPDLANTLKLRIVTFTNAGQSQNWFYTNSGKATVILTPEADKKVDNNIDLNKPIQPALESYKEYAGACISACGKFAWRDRPALIDKKGNLKLCVCEQCVKKKDPRSFKVCCHCGEHTFYQDNQKYVPLDSTGKMITFKDTKNQIIICGSCHSKLDETRFDPDPLYKMKKESTKKSKTVKFKLFAEQPVELAF
jgi:hypothetical protein